MLDDVMRGERGERDEVNVLSGKHLLPGYVLLASLFGSAKFNCLVKFPKFAGKLAELGLVLFKLRRLGIDLSLDLRKGGLKSAGSIGGDAGSSLESSGRSYGSST